MKNVFFSGAFGLFIYADLPARGDNERVRCDDPWVAVWHESRRHADGVDDVVHPVVHCDWL